MKSDRMARVNRQLQQVLAELVPGRINDPRAHAAAMITVVEVRTTPDLRHAKVHVSVMGDETRQDLSLQGLKSAAGFLQAKVAKRVDLRYTPRLNFVLDQGVKRSIEISEILDRILPRDIGVTGEPIDDNELQE